MSGKLTTDIAYVRTLKILECDRVILELETRADRIAALEAKVARYKWWHDYVMSRSGANEFFDGYGNTLRLTPLEPTKEG